MPSDVSLKEAFVSGHTGTTWLDILLITSVFPCARVVYALGYKASGTIASKHGQYVVECLTLLLPTLMACWTDETRYISASLVFFLTLLAVLMSLWPLDTKASTRRVGWMEVAKSMHSHPKSYVAVFRAGLTVYTCIAILAVDFRSFPRRLAKAETFGTGLMDLGPGLYVFSFGLMLGLRMQRQLAHRKALLQSIQKHLGAEHEGQVVKKCTHSRSNSPATLLLRAARSVGPLAALGAARLVLTKTVEYQEHQSEYGIHWNFFFTLASVACFTAILPLSGKTAASMAVALMVMYQGILLLPGWTEWLAGDDRDRSSLFDSNKEGIMSLFGYAALCYSGAASAALLDEDNRTAKWFRQFVLHRSSRVGISARSGALNVAAWHAALWCAVGVAWALAYAADVLVQPVSRRFANAAYVLWVLALALTQLQMSAIADIVSAVIAGTHAQRDCGLVHGLSRHQLAAFLVANLATGAVNLSIDTLGASEGSAFAIMMAYCLSWAYIGCWTDVAILAKDRVLGSGPGTKHNQE